VSHLFDNCDCCLSILPEYIVLPLSPRPIESSQWTKKISFAEGLVSGWLGKGYASGKHIDLTLGTYSYISPVQRVASG
jgi:hypothetical protein